MKIHDRKKKINVLLDRALKLVTIESLLTDPNVISELTVMLKVIDDLPEEKLDFYISEMMRIVTRRCSGL